MTQQSVRRSALDQAVLRMNGATETPAPGSGGCGADRLGEHDGAVAMQEMTEDDGLSVPRSSRMVR
jgi:hypothetical protein